MENDIIAIAGLGRGAFEKFLADGEAFKQLADREGGSDGMGGGSELGNVIEMGVELVGEGAILMAGGDRQGGDVGNAGEGLAAESKAAEGFQVIQRADFGGGVGERGFGEVFLRNAMAVIGDLDPGFAAIVEGDLDPGGPGIEGIFDELFDHGAGSVDDFACGDLGDGNGIEDVDGHLRRFTHDAHEDNTASEGVPNGEEKGAVQDH